MNQENEYWNSLLNRDSRADGNFVFAVRSTGIYCRPSCGSRHPRRENVQFFAIPRDAERAGYRPCKRCKPADGDRPDAHSELVRQVCEYIGENRESPVTLSALSRITSRSPYHIQRTFKKVLGISPRQYADQQRLKSVKSELRKSNGVTAAIYEAGYGSSSRLYERSSAQLGMTPATYRRGGRGMVIEYIIVECKLGQLLVGTTERGICALSLGDSESFLESALHREYPYAEIHRATSAHHEWVKALLRHFDGNERDLHLPLDLQATAFQRQVWEELRKIPYGTTRSYSEIAKAIGNPNAVRAVARACATNPAAIVIPCHRVVRDNGSLGGYRWGLKRKEALLQKEQSVAHNRDLRHKTG